jgi:ketosteroid isomerase-like protein
MTFRDTLEKHLRAVTHRDLAALAETLPEGPIVIISSDGRLVRSAAEFLEMHRGWFASSTWSLGFEEVSVTETADLGVAVLRLDYRDEPAGRPPLREVSYLTLVFARQDGRWVMIQDQNTPVRSSAAGG